MNHHKSRFYTAVLAVAIFLFLLIPPYSLAHADGVVITATVLPERTIIIDDKQTIVKIINNSQLYAEPKVYEQGHMQHRLAFNTYVKNQYALLGKSHDLSKAGVVYELKAANKKSGNWFNDMVNTIYQNYVENVLKAIF
ncbi:MAG: hypothetical protein JWO07_789 [Candidatus Saccharibacteria bacterium]|nr:hypothetical protein [Candidatus Saccharibacteria bacterium]